VVLIKTYLLQPTLLVVSFLQRTQLQLGR